MAVIGGGRAKERHVPPDFSIITVKNYSYLQLMYGFGFTTLSLFGPLSFSLWTPSGKLNFIIGRTRERERMSPRRFGLYIDERKRVCYERRLSDLVKSKKEI